MEVATPQIAVVHAEMGRLSGEPQALLAFHQPLLGTGAFHVDINARGQFCDQLHLVLRPLVGLAAHGGQQKRPVPIHHIGRAHLGAHAARRQSLQFHRTALLQQHIRADEGLTRRQRLPLRLGTQLRQGPNALKRRGTVRQVFVQHRGLSGGLVDFRQQAVAQLQIFGNALAGHLLQPGARVNPGQGLLQLDKEAEVTLPANALSDVVEKDGDFAAARPAEPEGVEIEPTAAQPFVFVNETNRFAGQNNFAVNVVPTLLMIRDQFAYPFSDDVVNSCQRHE